MKRAVFILNKKVLFILIPLAIFLMFSNSSVDAAWFIIDPPYVSLYWWLYGVQFTSSDEGWAVGADLANRKGVFLQFSGGTWAGVTPPSLSAEWLLNGGIHFTSSGEGWAVGRDLTNRRGVILRYTGGAWTNITPPFVSWNWWLNSVHFTASNEGWAVGADPSNRRGVLLYFFE